MSRVVISGISQKDKDKIFTELLIRSRKRGLTKFENFLFTLLYAERRKCEIEVVNNGDLLEVIDADYSKSLSVAQRFLYDDVIGESIRFDKFGNKKEILNRHLY